MSGDVVTFATVAAACLGVVVLVLLVGFNGLVRKRNRVEATWADLDVQLARRRDLVPNLVAAVAAYAEHERSLLTDAAALRTTAAGAADPRVRADEEAALDRRIDQLLVVAEEYPALRADERFAALVDELTATEDKIAFSRQLYNDTVQAYRTAAESFPGVLLARPLGFEPPEFFAATPDERLPGTVTRLHTGTDGDHGRTV